MDWYSVVGLIGFIMLFPVSIIFHEFGHAIILAVYNKTGKKIKLGFRRKINKDRIKRCLGFNENIFYIEVPVGMILDKRKSYEVYIMGYLIGLIPIVFYFNYFPATSFMITMVIAAYTIGSLNDIKGILMLWKANEKDTNTL